MGISTVLTTTRPPSNVLQGVPHRDRAFQGVEVEDALLPLVAKEARGLFGANVDSRLRSRAGRRSTSVVAVENYLIVVSIDLLDLTLDPLDSLAESAFPGSDGFFRCLHLERDEDEVRLETGGRCPGR